MHAPTWTLADAWRPSSRSHALLYDGVLTLAGSVLIALMAQLSLRLPWTPVPIPGRPLPYCWKQRRWGRVAVRAPWHSTCAWERPACLSSRSEAEALHICLDQRVATFSASSAQHGWWAGLPSTAGIAGSRQQHWRSYWATRSSTLLGCPGWRCLWAGVPFCRWGCSPSSSATSSSSFWQHFCYRQAGALCASSLPPVVFGRSVSALLEAAAPQLPLTAWWTPPSGAACSVGQKELRGRRDSNSRPPA
jgi:hypothetical protein